MQNRTVFLMIMTIFGYAAFRVWHGMLNEGVSVLRVISFIMIIIGMALILLGRIKGFMKEIMKNNRQ